jgi:hypothetical protein
MKDTSLQISAISHQVSPASLPDVSDGYCQRALVNESGMIRTQMRYVQQIINGRSAWDAL